MKSPISLSRFDLTILAVLAACALALMLLAWYSGSANEIPRSPQFLYLVSDEQGRNQLYLATLTDTGMIASTHQLTSSDSGIWDFAPTPDGGQIVFSALGELGISDLWTVSLPDGELAQLLACPNASCSNARYSPDGRLIAFAQRNSSEFSTAFFSPPRLWLLDSMGRETAAVFSDSQTLGFEPRWSADGHWLSYISPEPQGLGVINLEDGRTALYPNALGEPGIWAPTGLWMLTTNTWLEGTEYVTHLLRADVESGEVVDLSGEKALVSDSSATVSPDGNWIAFRRKMLTGPQATRGKQIWRMRVDGTDAEALTADAGYDYGSLDWSPDGRYLLTRRFPLAGPAIVPSIWLIDTQTGASRQLLEPGDQPIWLPYVSASPAPESARPGAAPRSEPAFRLSSRRRTGPAASVATRR